MQCALVGAEVGAGELSINISTGSQVSLVADHRRPGDYQTRPYFDGRWLHTIVQLPAGRFLGLLVSLLTEIAVRQGVTPPDPWAYIERAVSEVDATDLDVNLAFYAGAMGERGFVANIREDNATVGHLFAAAFRCLAENYAVCADRLSPNREWERIVLSGGLVQRFPRLRQDIHHRLGREAVNRVCASSEDALLGLLSLALVCSGRTASITEIRQRMTL